MARANLLFRPRRLECGASGRTVDLSAKSLGWPWLAFVVRQFASGEVCEMETGGDEVGLVLLSGTCRVGWDSETELLGPRSGVFGGYPHAAYIPRDTRFRLIAEGACEVAECRATCHERTERALTPRAIRPEDCGYEIRGGGNATRQIVDIMPPGFPADRLMICEVYTPSGNWSSYPPHKHDTDHPPDEVDLDEIYYFRFRDPHGYGFQRVYTAIDDETVKVEDGDVVAIREGYHPFVTAYGYDAYYLNVLAGERRSMAASDDPRYAQFRQSWPEPDPRLPLVPPPQGTENGERRTENGERRTFSRRRRT